MYRMFKLANSMLKLAQKAGTKQQSAASAQKTFDDIDDPNAKSGTTYYKSVAEGQKASEAAAARGKAAREARDSAAQAPPSSIDTALTASTTKPPVSAQQPVASGTTNQEQHTQTTPAPQEVVAEKTKANIKIIKYFVIKCMLLLTF